MGLFSFFDRFRASSSDRSEWGDFWFEPVTVRTGSGVRVSPDNAMRLAAVYACVRILSETMAELTDSSKSYIWELENKDAPNRLAAVQGNASAQANLGAMYGNGQGVIQDYVRAHMWANLAASKGSKVAAENRERNAKKMTTQKIAEAQKLARECQARDFKGC